MDLSLLSRLDQAYELAYFIHQDKPLALQISTDAIDHVDKHAIDQDKRRYYRPIGRLLSGLSRSRPTRNRISLTKVQLLQLLVLINSEAHELKQEEMGSGLSQDSLAVRYVTYLVRISLRRNAFYVALGLGRLLYAYNTRETMALYDLVQDPERYPTADYFRAQKKYLFERLVGRFEGLLKTCRGRYGERLFVSREPDERLAELVQRCLELLTPWETRCVVPEHFSPTEHRIAALRLRGRHPDDEHSTEVHRFHALLHPGCLRRLVRALEFPAPGQRLAVPWFNLPEAPSDSGGPPSRQDQPPELDEVDRQKVVEEIRRREDLRRRVAAGVFRVWVDGVETARWDVERNRRLRLVLAEDAERVEVVARERGEDVLLAAYLLPHIATEGVSLQSEADEPKVSADRLARARVRLEKGGKLDFTVSVASGAATDVRLEIQYRQAWVQRVLQLLGESLRIPVPRPLWQGAAASALLVLVIASMGLLLEWPRDSSWMPQIRGTGVAAAKLAEVENVFVEPLGQDPFRSSLRVRLEELLVVHGHLNLASERGDADAVILSEPGDFTPGDRLTLQLVNARGEVLWHGAFRGSAEQIAIESLVEIHAAIRSAGRR